MPYTPYTMDMKNVEESEEMECRELGKEEQSLVSA